MRNNILYKTMKAIFKIFGAGFTAFIILSVVLSCFYLVPSTEININKNTDWIWSKNFTWIKTDEGISFGHIDSKGYVNNFDVDNPDILLLGSSHTEAFNVMQNENFGYKLQEKLGNKHIIYNTGISGNSFVKVCDYLPDSMSCFKNIKYTIIETDSLNISRENFEQIKNHSARAPISKKSDIGSILNKSAFANKVFSQISKGLLNIFMPTPSQNTTVKDSKNASSDTETYDELCNYLQDIEQQYNTKIIIFIHPTEKLQKEGTIKFSDSEKIQAFSDVAKQHNITFIDLTSSFEKMYYDENHVPHGFITGTIGAGHLNKYGHTAIAENLYQTINHLEGDLQDAND